MTRSLKCIDGDCHECPGSSHGVMCGCTCHGSEDAEAAGWEDDD